MIDVTTFFRVRYILIDSKKLLVLVTENPRAVGFCLMEISSESQEDCLLRRDSLKNRRIAVLREFWI